MPTQYRMKLGDIAEGAAAEELRQRGWAVSDLNQGRRNFPNSDLEVGKDDLLKRIQVKACTVFGWISAGGVNPNVCAGGPIFNRVSGYPPADFVLCLTPTERVSKGTIPTAWRYFVLPVSVAEEAFRININAYFNGLKHDGTARSKKGACQDFVGPSQFKSASVPDHHDDYASYEGRFDLLEAQG